MFRIARVLLAVVIGVSVLSSTAEAGPLRATGRVAGRVLKAGKHVVCRVLHRARHPFRRG